MAIGLVPRRLPPVYRPAGQLGYFYNLHCLCPDQLGTTRPCGAHVARAACTAFGGRQAQRVCSCSVEVMLRYHNSVCKKAELIIPHHELTQTSDRMVTVASEGPVCVGWRHWWAATLSNGPGEAGDSRGATWAMLRSRRPGGWTAGRRGEAGGGRGEPCARRACEGSAATACAAAGELLRRLWLGQRHPYDWGHRWERRRRVLGGDWGVGAPRERPSEVPRCRGHDGVVETAAGTCLHAARAVLLSFYVEQYREAEEKERRDQRVSGRVSGRVAERDAARAAIKAHDEHTPQCEEAFTRAPRNQMTRA